MSYQQTIPGRRVHAWSRPALFASIAALIAAGCAGVRGGGPASADGTGGSSGTGGAPGTPPPGRRGGGGGGVIPGGADAGADSSVSFRLTDFPATPIIDPSAPPGAADLFDSTPPRTGGAPCIASPERATLMPRNWLRPRFDYAAAAGENLFEIDLTVAGFAHPLRIFTANTSYALDLDLWNHLRMSVNDRTITVSVRALALDSHGTVTVAPSAAGTSSFVIAPVDAPGKIVYWSLDNDLGTKVGSLKGFGIGDESVQVVLRPSQVATKGTSDTCIGCHAATPEGNSVGFPMGPQRYANTVSQVGAGVAGALPSFVTPTAFATMQGLHGIPAYSKGHWTPGDRIVLLSDTGTLNWVQVDGTTSGVLARTGDANRATEPTFSHDGNSVVYVSTQSIVDGRLDNGPADLTWIPYAGRQGGAATGLPGASDPGYTEYYPAFSPDDRWVAFTRIAGSGSAYSNSAAELFVVPFNAGHGGTAIRLAANDPSACQTGLASPGLTNDWPKWSPSVSNANGKVYYWLTFSSKRTGANNAQLYITAITIDEVGTTVTYPALYLWNQPAADSNHTPSWDEFAPSVIP
jgi:hypothetical protein